MRLKNINEIVSLILMSVTICLLFQFKQTILIYDLFGPDSTFIISLIALSIFVVYYVASGNLSLNDVLLLVLSLLLFSLFPMLNSVAFDESHFPYGVFFAVIVIFFHSHLAVNVRPENHKYLLIPFYFILFFIVYRIYLVLLPNLVFVNSKNWISYYLILAVTPYYFVSFLKRTNLTVIPVALTFVLSVYSTSRSGMIASFIMLVSVLYYLYGHRVIYMIVAFLIIPVLIYWQEIFDMIVAVDVYGDSRFSSSTFLSDARFTIFSYYFGKIDMYDVLTGIPGREMFFPIINSTNPHSSYLNAMIGGGLIHFSIIMSCVVFSLYVYRNNFPFFLFYVSVLLRIATDTGSLLVYFDVFLFIPLMYYFKGSKPNSIRKCSGVKLTHTSGVERLYYTI